MGCKCCKCLEPLFNAIGCSCHDDDAGKGARSINKNRNCTDLPWVVIFLGGLCGLFYIWGTAFNDGDIDKLMLPNDYHGNICGKGDMKDKPVGVWPDVDTFGFKICAEDCSATWDNFQPNSFAEHYTTDPALVVSDMVIGYWSDEHAKFCLPSSGEDDVDGYDDASQQARRQVEDLYTTMPIIGASAAIALFLGFFFVYLMRKMLKCIVWGGVTLIFVGGALCAYSLYTSAANIKDEDTRLMQQIAGGVIGGLTILFLIVVICLRDRIAIAIEVIKSAGRAMADVPMIVLTPFFPQLCAITFVMVWILATAHMFSMANTYDIDTPETILELQTRFTDPLTGEGFMNSYGEHYPSTYSRLDYDSVITNTFYFHFFMLLWTLQMLTYWLYMVVAGVIADWYFTKREGEDGPKVRGDADDELSNRPICGSFCRSLRNFGTLVFASAIIATIQFIRWMLRYMEKQMRGQNQIAQYFICILDCLLGCLESCMDCISKRALIITAITGKPLCSSFSITFNIVWVNMVRVSVMMMFTSIVIFVGKVCVTLACTGISVLIMYYVYEDLSGIFLPMVVIFLLSYVIASAFMTVYETAVDTVFLCFLLDEEWNQKTEGGDKMFADKALHDIVAKYEDQSRELAEKEGAGKKKTEEGADYSAAAAAPNTEEGIKV